MIGEKIRDEKDESFRIVFCALGDSRNKEYDFNSDKSDKKIVQKTWDKILKFIYRRYKSHWDEKKEHSQWPCIGKELWDLSEKYDETAFVNYILYYLDSSSKCNF